MGRQIRKATLWGDLLPVNVVTNSPPQSLASLKIVVVKVKPIRVLVALLQHDGKRIHLIRAVQTRIYDVTRHIKTKKERNEHLSRRRKKKDKESRTRIQPPSPVITLQCRVIKHHSRVKPAHVAIPDSAQLPREP